MVSFSQYPLLTFAVTLAVLWLAAWIGSHGFKRLRVQLTNSRDDFAVIQGAVLTLLGLIIGFTFSMALARYDQRKNYEEEEANAIGTEYLRAELLQEADATKVKDLLRRYLDQRILFYTTRDDGELAQIDAATARLQRQLWDAVRGPAVAQPSPISALVIAGMNDVLNTQGYTQAAWWNRIPPAAWLLMLAIAVCATLLVGLGTRHQGASSRLLAVLPVVVAIAFFMIADIDSPRRGLIRVVPQNLLTLADSFRSP